MASRLKHFPFLSEHYSTALMRLFTTETTAKSCNKSIESGASVPNPDLQDIIFANGTLKCRIVIYDKNLFMTRGREDKIIMEVKSMIVFWLILFTQL